MLQSVKNNTVSILPGLFRERMDVNRSYLMELDSTCLLQNFYLEAGFILPGLQVIEHPESANLHWGWEAPNCQLRGHFLGHFLSAAAHYTAFDGDILLKAKLDHIVAELAKCQEENGGEWVGSIPKKYFERLARNQYIWSPQYTMHKTILGLMHAYSYAGNEQALAIIDKLADWYIRWADAMQSINPHAVYSGEEGGMLEVWATLYELTKNEKYMTLVKHYYAPSLFRKLEEGKDALTNCHSNASVPLSHGAAKLYEITGDERWLNLVKLFFDCAVTKRGMFATGGGNAGEFWVPPFMQGQFLSDRDQEFCTIYNMVRTASYLFRFTGESKYGDYIERCLYNGFLAQQNAVTGMPTYFLPLRAGGHKKWGTRRHDFWCCHGTMVQAQCLYPELIYYEDAAADTLYINQYIPSEYHFALGGASGTIRQTTAMKAYNAQALFDEKDDGQMSRWLLKFEINAANTEGLTLALRVPSWCQGILRVQVNEEDVASPVIKDGFLYFKEGLDQAVITIFFKNLLHTEALADIPELTAILDGPIVLAGMTDKDTGIRGDMAHPESFLAPRNEHTYETYPWQQNHYSTRNQDINFELKPLYEVMDEAYTVYFTAKQDKSC